MIELAPHSKQGLALASPLMAGSGAAGFADAWPPGVSAEMFGAVVTAPLSLAARRGAAPPRLAEAPGGFILATGGQNPGYRRVVERYGRAWRRLGVPLLVAFFEGDTGAWADLAARLEEDGIAAGIELHLPEAGAVDDAAGAVAAVRRATTLPVLARLPVVRAAKLAEACVRAGADTLVVGTPPHGAYPAPGGMIVEGPVAGPIAFPFTLAALRRVAALGVEAPLVATGGIGSLEQVKLCLQAGAVAVQVRSLLWTDPAAAARLAQAARAG